MVLMRKDILYECVKRYVMKRNEDPYAFSTPSLRTRKFNFSCCDLLRREANANVISIGNHTVSSSIWN